MIMAIFSYLHSVSCLDIFEAFNISLWSSQVKYIGVVAGEFCDTGQGGCKVNVDLDAVVMIIALIIFT